MQVKGGEGLVCIQVYTRRQLQYNTGSDIVRPLYQLQYNTGSDIIRPLYLKIIA